MLRPILLTADTSATNSSFDTVMEAANSLVTFAGNLFTTILENPVLVIFVGASFVGIGLTIVRLLKKTARS